LRVTHHPRLDYPQDQPAPQPTSTIEDSTTPLTLLKKPK
jgi:hypothetical protein